jgi:hypothetical protein
VAERYQQRVVVEAMRFDGDTEPLDQFVGIDGWTRSDAVDMPYTGDGHEVVVWCENQGAHVPCPLGHWVVSGPAAGFFVYSPDAFSATHEGVDCRCGHPERSHRPTCGFVDIDEDREPARCRCTSFVRAAAGSPPQTPAPTREQVRALLVEHGGRGWLFGTASSLDRATDAVMALLSAQPAPPLWTGPASLLRLTLHERGANAIGVEPAAAVEVREAKP